MARYHDILILDAILLPNYCRQWPIGRKTKIFYLFILASKPICTFHLSQKKSRVIAPIPFSYHVPDQLFSRGSLRKQLWPYSVDRVCCFGVGWGCWLGVDYQAPHLSIKPMGDTGALPNLMAGNTKDIHILFYDISEDGYDSYSRATAYDRVLKMPTRKLNID